MQQITSSCNTSKLNSKTSTTVHRGQELRGITLTCSVLYLDLF